MCSQRKRFHFILWIRKSDWLSHCLSFVDRKQYLTLRETKYYWAIRSCSTGIYLFSAEIVFLSVCLSSSLSTSGVQFICGFCWTNWSYWQSKLSKRTQLQADSPTHDCNLESRSSSCERPPSLLPPSPFPIARYPVVSKPVHLSLGLVCFQRPSPCS